MTRVPMTLATWRRRWSVAPSATAGTSTTGNRVFMGRSARQEGGGRVDRPRESYTDLAPAGAPTAVVTSEALRWPASDLCDRLMGLHVHVDVAPLPIPGVDGRAHARSMPWRLPAEPVGGHRDRS
jgi:hypothetical protein